jgi:hypothetical protein
MLSAKSSSTNREFLPGSPGHRSHRVEVREFACLKPGGTLMQVFRYHTVYSPNGQVRRDILSQEELLGNIIESFNGRLVSVDGVLSGEFDNADDARACGHAIAIYQSRPVEVDGKLIILSV